MAPDRLSASCQIEINVIFGELSSQPHDGSGPQTGFEELPSPMFFCSLTLGFCAAIRSLSSLKV